MTAAHRSQALQPVYVLHARPYRETSLLVEAFARDAGRIALVARGARRPRSAVRGLLLPFQPLSLSWFGKGELRTLKQAEWQGGQLPLTGSALMCGFYLNELLLRLLPRDDPHPALFGHYQTALMALGHQQPQAPVLRRFEKALLQELGYALMLEHEAQGDVPIDPNAFYVYEPERGPVRRTAGEGGVQLRGRTLLDLARDDYSDPVTLAQAKQLMRMLIAHQLGSDALQTRQLLMDLQEL
ncbi:DNA repair protein RecO [Thiobacter aerophilum]|uniref:DNA repair protein RecO n=1 Tax=Thiobacter aerophilum TaxID=3121275 RepID=A0ABV0EDU0_9BURK